MIFSTNDMKKYTLYLTLLFLVISCQQQKQKAFNVVVLFTDDQRFNTIQAWGNESIYTPNMNRLAKMGVSFTRAHVMGSHHGAVCAPSRAMLLSGRSYMNIPKSYIDRGSDYQKNFDFITFPEWFQQQAYATFFTGKWHNHTSKLRQGFQFGKNIFIGGMHWPDEGGHDQPWLWNLDPTGQYPANAKWQGDEFSSKLYSDAAIEFIQQQGGGQAFCLYVAYTSPHDPRMAPNEYLNLYDTATIKLPPNFLPQHPFDNGNLGIRDELLAPFPRTKTIIKEEIKGYYAMISEVDAQIGRILDALEAQGLMKQTIIVFAGDNGLAVGQHGLLGKQNLYEHSVRVPLIIAAPNIVGNREAHTLCYLQDIFPTLCELNQQVAPAGIEGKSLFPALMDETSSIYSAVFLSHAQQMRAIRTDDDWKLIQTFAQGKNYTQLFNLSTDPWETNNLAEQKDYANQLKVLSNQLIDSIQAYKDVFIQPSIELSYRHFDAPVEVQISHPFSSIVLHYTTDGSQPTANSPRYTNPFTVVKSSTIRAAAFRDKIMINQSISAEIPVIKNILSVTWDKAPSDKYKGNGVFTLVDGLRGSLAFKDGRWLGFHGDDVSIVVERKQVKTLSKVGLGYLQKTKDWIFPPKAIHISISENGNDFQEVGAAHIVSTETMKPEIAVFEKNIPPSSIRFIRYEVKNIGLCPEWHVGKGKKAWLFIDELIAE